MKRTWVYASLYSPLASGWEQGSLASEQPTASCIKQFIICLFYFSVFLLHSPCFFVFLLHSPCFLFFCYIHLVFCFFFYINLFLFFFFIYLGVVICVEKGRREVPRGHWSPCLAQIVNDFFLEISNLSENFLMCSFGHVLNTHVLCSLLHYTCEAAIRSQTIRHTNFRVHL